MNVDILTKRHLKKINDAIYQLSLAKPLIETLKEAGRDVSEQEIAHDHALRELTAYKRLAEGRKE